jgi:urease accessory protein
MPRPAPIWLAVPSGAVAVFAAAPAMAHHVMGGAMPTTFLQGLLSGLGHPIIGLDHFAFIIAVGLISALTDRPVLLPAAFIAGTLAGCAAHVAGVDLPFAEVVIALGIAGGAALIALRLTVSAGLLAGVFFALGIFHGYAYGESIVGAEPAPLTAYLLGFSAVQYAVATSAAMALRFVTTKQLAAEKVVARIAGLVMLLVAGVALTAALAGG